MSKQELSKLQPENKPGFETQSTCRNINHINQIFKSIKNAVIFDVL